MLACVKGSHNTVTYTSMRIFMIYFVIFVPIYYYKHRTQVHLAMRQTDQYSTLKQVQNAEWDHIFGN